ncbi:D-amino acid dehydrogenase [Oligella urethralis]|uniref:NAD(P)/FAD-dependent oxidoreductase n=1 Tax=Oligella urethralis TaxID=90245 RepID=UPI002958D632|nr:FAD-binding oxidoreductase [Oligella urethralis]WOS36897.1 D-amino acid dehydrogenase [Oligella urethralis]
MTDSTDVIVIGAGIVGVNIALKLRQKGFETLLLDRGEPISGCSSGNAGVIATYAVAPLSLPGLWKQVPKMLFDHQGPLTIRLKHFFKVLPWLLKFTLSSRRAIVEENSLVLKDLVEGSLKSYLDLCQDLNIQELIKPSPLLCVYKSRKDYENDTLIWSLRKKLGVKWRVLECEGLRRFEPAVSAEFKFAALLEGAGFTLNPQLLGESIFDEYLRLGGEFKKLNVEKIQILQDVKLIHSAKEILKARKIVIAGGAWSGFLANQLGEKVSLEAERGYHFNLSNFKGSGPKVPIMSPAHKVIATPMMNGLRIAGMVEFGGFLPPDYSRADVLREQLHQVFPSISGGVSSCWMGHRPTLPDSLPVISPSSIHSDVFYAFGHHHIGLTCAPITASLIVELISGHTPSIDLAPFSIGRF